MKPQTITTAELAKVLFSAKVKVGVKNETHYLGREDEEYEIQELECVVLESENNDGLVADDVYIYENGDQVIDGFGINNAKTNEFTVVHLTDQQKKLVETYLEAIFSEITDTVENLISDIEYEFRNVSHFQYEENNLTEIYETI